MVVVLAEAQGSHANVRPALMFRLALGVFLVDAGDWGPSEVLEFAVAHGAAGDEISAGGGHRERRHGRDVRHHLRVALAIHGRRQRRAPPSREPVKTTPGVPSADAARLTMIAGKPFSRRSVRARRASSAASSSAAAFASASAASSSGVFSSSIGEGARDRFGVPASKSESSVASGTPAPSFSLSDSLHWYATPRHSPRSDLASQVTTAVDSPATYRTSPSRAPPRAPPRDPRRRRGGTSPGARGRGRDQRFTEPSREPVYREPPSGEKSGARHRREVAALLLLLGGLFRRRRAGGRAGGGRAGRRLAGRTRRRLGRVVAVGVRLAGHRLGETVLSFTAGHLRLDLRLGLRLRLGRLRLGLSLRLRLGRGRSGRTFLVTIAVAVHPRARARAGTAGRPGWMTPTRVGARSSSRRCTSYTAADPSSKPTAIRSPRAHTRDARDEPRPTSTRPRRSPSSDRGAAGVRRRRRGWACSRPHEAYSAATGGRRSPASSSSGARSVSGPHRARAAARAAARPFQGAAAGGASRETLAGALEGSAPDLRGFFARAALSSSFSFPSASSDGSGENSPVGEHSLGQCSGSKGPRGGLAGRRAVRVCRCGTWSARGGARPWRSGARKTQDMASGDGAGGGRWTNSGMPGGRWSWTFAPRGEAEV